MRVLLIEDQQKLAENLRQYLELEHFDVTVHRDGAAGFAAAAGEDFDVIVLDVNLPGMDGYTVCAMLRQRGRQTPIIMLTARTTQREIVHGLSIGADDYLTKPFDLEELVARIRALLRRKQPGLPARLQVDDVEIDTNTQEAWRAGAPVALSPKEFALLHHLLQHRGVVQDRATILEQVWGGRDELLFSQTVDVHVSYLRRKLGKQIIRTVPGRGYLVPAT